MAKLVHPHVPGLGQTDINDFYLLFFDVFEKGKMKKLMALEATKV
jgi:hypothetical protein